MQDERVELDVLAHLRRAGIFQDRLQGFEDGRRIELALGVVDRDEERLGGLQRERKADEFATAATPSLAICRAALLATRNRKQPSNNLVPGVFFSAIEKELAKTMGPIAPIIVEDKVAEFGEARDSFPKDKADALVHAIGEEIEDGEERASFTEAMAEFFHRRRR